MFGLHVTTKLTDAQYGSAWEFPMRRVPTDGYPPFDFWSYVDGIPPEDFEGHQIQQTVTWAWEDANGRYQHVLLDTEDKNVFMVIILELWRREIFGHRLLDLNLEYGLNAEPGASPNGGPAMHFENPGAMEGPPSVS
jgi:hypothetical protein